MSRARNPENEFTPNSQGTIAKLNVREQLIVQGVPISPGTLGITGGGTPGTLPIFTAPTEVGDSVVSYDPTPGIDALLVSGRIIQSYRPNSTGQHGGFICAASGLADVTAEGGVQTFNNAEYDITTQSQQAFSLVSECNVTRIAPPETAHTLTSCSAMLRATGGDVNMALYIPADSGFARMDCLVTAENLNVASLASTTDLTASGTSNLTGPVNLGAVGVGIAPVHVLGDMTCDGNGNYHNAFTVQGSAQIGNDTFRGSLTLQTQNDANALLVGYNAIVAPFDPLKWWSLYPSGGDLRLWEFNNGEGPSGAGADKFRFASGGTVCAAQGFAQAADGSGPVWRSGAGSPEGVVVAPVGSLYSRTDGGAGSTLYVKESGVGAAGWVAK